MGKKVWYNDKKQGGMPLSRGVCPGAVLPRREREENFLGIMRLHYLKLCLRGGLLAAAVVAALVDKELLLYSPYIGLHGGFNLLTIIWICFVLEMVARFFPYRGESMGCQKQFARNFIPTQVTELPEALRRRHRQAVERVAAVWLIPNALIGAAYLAGYLGQAALLLLSLFYSVCDIICILFFCPFQSLLMKNRCCVNCRIYNWDFAMMFTPLVFVPGVYTWTLLALALALLVKWEYTYAKTPQRFSELTNEGLSCAHCEEHLCTHKRAIQKLAAQQRAQAQALAISLTRTLDEGENPERKSGAGGS